MAHGRLALALFLFTAATAACHKTPAASGLDRLASAGPTLPVPRPRTGDLAPETRTQPVAPVVVAREVSAGFETIAAAIHVDGPSAWSYTVSVDEAPGRPQPYSFVVPWPQ